MRVCTFKVKSEWRAVSSRFGIFFNTLQRLLTPTGHTHELSAAFFRGGRRLFFRVRFFFFWRWIMWNTLIGWLITVVAHQQLIISPEATYCCWRYMTISCSQRFYFERKQWAFLLSEKHVCIFGKQINYFRFLSWWQLDYNEYKTKNNANFRCPFESYNTLGK